MRLCGQLAGKTLWFVGGWLLDKNSLVGEDVRVKEFVIVGLVNRTLK